MRRMVNGGDKLVYQNGQFGVLSNKVASYQAIKSGETYHVVIPKGVKIRNTDEYIAGTITNFKPTNLIVNRGDMGNWQGQRLGRSSGAQDFYVCVFGDTANQNGVVIDGSTDQTQEQVEFDILVIEYQSGTMDNLYQYLIGKDKVFTPFKM